jgi:Ca2+-binding RTX toxin-like protein
MSRNARRPALTAAVVGAAAVAAVVLSAEPAFALGPATVTKSGTVLTLTASPGAQDTIRIQEGATTFTLRDLAGLRPGVGSGCTSVPTGTSDLVCSKAGITRLVVNAGDFDDTIGIGAPAGSAVTYEAFGGAGNDAFALNTPHSIEHGGAGNDVLANTSRQFATTLDGGSGTDRCARGTARDVVVSCEVIP